MHTAHNCFRSSFSLFLLGEPEVKRPLGISRRRREDNIKMDLQEAG